MSEGVKPVSTQPLRNVYPAEHPHLSAFDLFSRGWTETMIQRFLGPEDRRTPVDHWANWQGARAYALDRVERAESTPEFEKYFLASSKRRRLSDAFREEVLARIREYQRIGRDKFPPIEASHMDRLAAAVGAIFEEGWRMGYRMPFKCNPNPSLRDPA